jgi:hypothetical protein
MFTPTSVQTNAKVDAKEKYWDKFMKCKDHDLAPQTRKDCFKEFAENRDQNEAVAGDIGDSTRMRLGPGRPVDAVRNPAVRKETMLDRHQANPVRSNPNRWRRLTASDRQAVQRGQKVQAMIDRHKNDPPTRLTADDIVAGGGFKEFAENRDILLRKSEAPSPGSNDRMYRRPVPGQTDEAPSPGSNDRMYRRPVPGPQTRKD